MDQCEHTVANLCHIVVIFFTVWTLCGSMWTHCGKLMSQSGKFLHSVGTMWIYVNTLWWINATEWQFASQCGHYVALCEHTVVNSVHCCDYVNTVWISLSHSEGANSYSVDIFTLWQLYCPTLAKGSKWHTIQIWVIGVFIFHLMCSSSRPNFRQKHSSC